MLDGVGVIVGVGVGVRVGVMVGVRLGVRVGVIVGVVVAVGVLEGVSVKLDVGVTEGVRDGVGVGVSVGSIVGTTGVALPSDRGRYTTEWESAWADAANKHDAHTALNNRARTEPSLPEVSGLTESGTPPPRGAPNTLRHARWYTGSHGRQVAEEEHHGAVAGLVPSRPMAGYRPVSETRRSCASWSSQWPIPGTGIPTPAIPEDRREPGRVGRGVAQASPSPACSPTDGSPTLRSCQRSVRE